MAVDTPLVVTGVTVFQSMVMIGRAEILDPGMVVTSVVPLLVIVVIIGITEAGREDCD